MLEERERLKAGLRPEQRRRLESLAVQVTIKQNPAETGDKNHGRAVLPNQKETPMETMTHQATETTARVKAVENLSPAESAVIDGIAKSVLTEQEMLSQMRELNAKFEASQSFATKAKDVGIFMGGAVIVSGAFWGLSRLFAKKAPAPLPVAAEGAVRK